MDGEGRRMMSVGRGGEGDRKEEEREMNDFNIYWRNSSHLFN